MGAIPSSDMPGHKKLHERVFHALDLCQESKNIEFKESRPWEDIKWHIVRTTLAMGNLRDGGIIVIGASERCEAWQLTGIVEEHILTFDVDDVVDFLNKFSSPPIKIDLVTVKYRNGNTFLAIQANEFTESPFILKKNGPDTEKMLRAGNIFIRTDSKPQTTRITSADQMNDLLELAAEKRARRILETAYKIGLKAVDTNFKKFEEELEGL